jgi:hypothetical protein
MTPTDIGMGIFIFCLIVPLMIVFATAGLVGIFFDIVLLLISSPFVYLWYLGRKKNRQREIERREILQHSTSLPSWKGSKATLTEIPNQPIRVDLQISLQFCPHLVKLSSLMIKCPKCQCVFPRYVTILRTAFIGHKYVSLKSGELSIAEIVRREIRNNGCPSSFRCPKCNTTIIRSREPSGMCQLYGKRVYGEKLFCCTINQCI